MAESIREAVEALTLEEETCPVCGFSPCNPGSVDHETIAHNVLDIPDADLVPQLSRQIQTQFVEMTRVEKYAMSLHASLADLVGILERNGGHLWHDELEALWRAKELLK